jgi:hypothetical protein
MRPFIYISIASLILIGLVSRFSRSSSTLDIFITEYAIFAYFGIVAFAIYRAKWSKGELGTNKVLSEGDTKILDAIFLLSLLLALYSLKEAIYTKPLPYYIFVSLASVALGLQILFSREIIRKKLLIQVLALAVIVRLSSSVINPYFIGWDAYWHYNYFSSIVATGKLDATAQHYFYYPFFHLVNVIPLILTVLDSSIILLISLVTSILAILAIYFIAEDLSGERAGLAAALLLSVSTLHIYRSGGIHRPEITFILLSLLVVQKAPYYKISRSWTVFWLTALGVFFIHPTGVVVLILLLGANFFMRNLRLYKSELKITPFISYAIGFVAYLMFVHYSLFVDTVKILFIPDEEVAPLITILPLAVQKVVTARYYIEAYLSYFGMATVLLLGVVGGLMWLEKRKSDGLSIIIGIILIYLIPVYSVVRGIFEAQPSRFLVFGNIITVIPASIGLVAVSRMMENKRISILSMFFLLSLYSFFSLTSYLTGDDNGLFNKELPYDQRHATQSTLAVYNFIKNIDPGDQIFVDEEMTQYMFSGKRGVIQAEQKNVKPLGYKTTEETGFFVINVPKLNKGYIWDMKLGEEFMDNFKIDSRVYDNGNVVIFEK